MCKWKETAGMYVSAKYNGNICQSQAMGCVAATTKASEIKQTQVAYRRFASGEEHPWPKDTWV